LKQITSGSGRGTLLNEAGDAARVRVAGSGSGVEADSFGEFGLAIIERPEFLGAQLKGAGHVEGVKGADTEGGAVVPSEINAGFPGSLRKIDRNEGCF